MRPDRPVPGNRKQTQTSEPALSPDTVHTHPVLPLYFCLLSLPHLTLLFAQAKCCQQFGCNSPPSHRCPAETFHSSQWGVFPYKVQRVVVVLLKSLWRLYCDTQHTQCQWRTMLQLVSASAYKTKKNKTWTIYSFQNSYSHWKSQTDPSVCPEAHKSWKFDYRDLHPPPEFMERSGRSGKTQGDQSISYTI